MYFFSMDMIMNPAISRVGRAGEIAQYTWNTSRRIAKIQKGVASPEIRKALVDDTARAGTLFIKLSQFISSRGDILDEDTARELARLQDAVPCEPETPEIPGYEITPRAIASASIASVFEGRRLRDGKRVAIKVIRKGVREGIFSDFPLLVGVLKLAKSLDLAGAANMLEIVQECRPMLEAELDLRGEAKAQDAFKRKFSGIEWLQVPKVYEAGKSYMISEFVPSRKITDAVPSKFLARRLFELYVRMVLEAGVVHADPHAGNIGARGDGTFVLYDFGAIIDIKNARPGLAGVLKGAITDDIDGAIKALADVGIIKSDRDSLRKLRAATPRLKKLLRSPDINKELAEIPEFSSNEDRLFELTTRYVYLIRSLVIVQGLVTYHDPSFSLKEYCEFYEELIEELIEELVDVDFMDVARDFIGDAVSAPSQLKAVREAVGELSDSVRESSEKRDSLDISSFVAANGLLYLVFFILERIL
jgi:predicted unusual protein kinase regulating ubiquinone biosynthesis (AarF/ABC1/UbiB family)